ncbi:MAG TPA: hypothetical protein VK472_00485 [Allosphingosinicella sp.]|nr:hypothetical protein [Allosphingosinicella sp.]
MFVSGSVTLNGVVKPADSTLNLAPNCGFFVWTEQMFLWLTSPAPASYGGGGRIMLSPAFYTVSPVGADGRRTFLRNQLDRPLAMALRMTELGPHDLPALLTRSGQVVEVQSVERQPREPLIRLQSGKAVKLGTIRRLQGGELQFLDPAGRPLNVRKLAPPPVKRQMIQMPDGRRAALIPPRAIQNAVRARKLIFGNIPVFLDSAGNVIDTEPGQADGGVLLSQNGSLIFYITHVNQMYAWHRTMQGPGLIPGGTSIRFPLTAADGAAVSAFATAHGATIIDPEALAIETKSSWVEATSVANPNDYVSASATIPTFDKSNPELWVPNGQKTVKMVMVGIHVVGSTFGHGEMVWGSMEHLGNTPNAAYSYNSTTGLKNIGQNTSGTWLFTPNGSGGPFNNMNASWDTSTGNLVSTSPGTPIAPVPILREFPWGMPGGSTSMNTQVISANAAVISQLIAGDVRRKYFQIGTTWTIGGAAPNGANEVGTNQLANTTMETFVQGSNCFSCHTTNKVVVSHVYSKLKPLP